MAVFLFLPWMWCSPETANAEVATSPLSAPEIVAVEVGLSGWYQVGRWSPITVDVRPPAGDDWRVMVTVPDPDGHPTRMPLTPLATGAEGAPATPGVVRCRGLFRNGRSEEPLRVDLLQGSRVLATRTLPASREGAQRPLTTSSSLWIVLGDSELFEELDSWLEQRAEEGENTLIRRVITLHAEELRSLPDDPRAYESVDVVIVGDRYELSVAEDAALRAWVQSGGRLIVSIGSRWHSLRETALFEWIPVSVIRARTLTTLSPLTGLVNTNAPINLFEPIVGVELATSGIRVLASGPEGVLVARAAYGLGNVTVTAFDLDHPVLVNWEPIRELGLTLAGVEESALVRPRAKSGAEEAIGSGITELHTQLVTALDHYPGIERISNWSVLGLLGLYVVVIGLVDYQLVHRWWRKPWVTWITLPVWICLGMLVISQFGSSTGGSSSADPAVSDSGNVAGRGRSTAGQGELVRRLELIDVLEDQRTMQVHHWLAMYSPESRRQDVQATVYPPGGGTVPLPLSWSGIPEQGFRGMYRPGGLILGEPVYDYDPVTLGLRGFPLMTQASRVLEGSLFQIARDTEMPSLVVGALRDDGTGQLQGSLTHHWPTPITDWFMAYRNTIYFPFTDMPLPPGEPIQPQSHRQWVIRAFLTGTGARLVSSGGARVDTVLGREAYNTQSRDLDAILRMISFHNAAGSRSYTGLTNHYLTPFDLTELISLNRAVLFGRVAEPTVVVEVDGRPVEGEVSTYIRLIVPVERN